MNNAPRTEPPFTNCPRTEKIFPFKRTLDGNWYRYQSEEICLCEELERENQILHDDFVNANGRCDMMMKENAKLREDKERLEFLLATLLVRK